MALKKNEGNKEVKATYEVTVLRAKQFENGSVGFDMEVNGVKIYNCFARTVKSKKSGEDVDIIDFPQYKAKNGEYYSYAFFPISFELKTDIINQINSLLG